MDNEVRFDIPEYVSNYITGSGYPFPYTVMQPYIEQWYRWMGATGDFYDCNKSDQSGHIYKYHRLSCHPARSVCREWASLMLNDNTSVSTEDETCTEWINDYYSSTGFYTRGQGLIERAFGLGTGVWAVWVDTVRKVMQPQRYDARMCIPLSWDDDGIYEIALISDVVIDGKSATQLQMITLESDGYHIHTAIWIDNNRVPLPDGVMDDFIFGPVKPFAVVRPAIENSRVDLSPYGESVFADAVDAIKAVDICFDAMFNELRLGKMRVFMSDLLLDTQMKGTEKVIMPWSDDDQVLRRITSTDNIVQTFAPQLRTQSQDMAFQRAWDTLGSLTGFGQHYFKTDEGGGVRTATEVASNNAELMRSIKKHENLLADAVCDLSHALIYAAREHIGIPLPDEGIITFNPDDSIVTDTTAEKAQDMAEVAQGLMNVWEYRAKWYDEDEETAKANTPGSVTEDYIPVGQ